MAIQANADQSKRPVPPSRFSVAKVSRGRVEHAMWVHLYGPEGVGKSSFGAEAPDPIFIDVEQGTEDIPTTRFLFEQPSDAHPKGRTWPADFDEFLEAVRTVERDPGPYRTLVIDTLDAVEALIWRYVCERDEKANIAAYGFGKGENVVALDEWRRLVAALERVRARGINVVTLSHSIVRRFDDPASEGWDRFTLKLHDKAAGLIKERSNAVLFANFEVVLKKKPGDAPGKKKMAVATDARWIYTHRTGAYDAKNRNNLPDELPLSWAELWAAMQAGRPATPEAMREAITGKGSRLPEEQRVRLLGFITEAGDDPVKLAKINTWVNAKLAEAGTASEEAES